MTLPLPPSGPWTSPRSPRHSLHPMPLDLLKALEAGDLQLASAVAPASLPPLPPFLINDADRVTLAFRLALVAEDPAHLRWISKFIVYEPEKNMDAEISDTEKPKTVIVGRIGFHEKPDERGMVEVGYEIDEKERGKGHVKAAMKIMVDVARSVEGVKILRASVAPQNLISRRVVESEGLRKVGSEVHERRGLEDIFEMDVSA